LGECARHQRRRAALIATDTPAHRSSAPACSWEREGNFISWLNLAPNHKISGGKIIGRDKRKVVNRVGQALRQAASTLLPSPTVSVLNIAVFGLN
jgi:hypothetical protein